MYLIGLIAPEQSIYSFAPLTPCRFIVKGFMFNFLRLLMIYLYYVHPRGRFTPITLNNQLEGGGGVTVSVFHSPVASI